jgi:prolipoprotein diacylglyceryl transferase
MTLLSITWDANPAIFQVGSYEFRWYTLMFFIGFAVGYQIVKRMFKNEKISLAWLEPLLYYTFFGMMFGARLGHCLFYDPAYYLSNPFEILKVWEGGLASHGGVIGIIIAIYFFSKKVSRKSMMWTFDKLVTPTGLVAALIRFGNLMNSEIIGHATDLPWGVRFVRSADWIRYANGMPCHPAQIYEAICYFLTFILCMWLYFKKDAWKKEGLIFGIFMICIFASRFFIEFLKMPQVASEADMLLNRGQLLSIPFVLAGIYFVWKAGRK